MGKTNKITDGAMLIAIFTVLTLINRYTGAAFQDIIIYIMPVPMTAFAVKYGFKDGIPVAAGMALMSAFMGNPTGIFYAATQALIGLVFGGCIYAKTDGTKTLFLLMVMSALSTVINTIIFASFFSYDIGAQIAQMQTMMTEMLTRAGVVIPEGLLTYSSILRIMAISAVFSGVIQGYLTYYIGLAVLKRLRFQVEKPKSIFLSYPKKITGHIAIFIFFVYIYTGTLAVDGNLLMTSLQVISMCAMLYLVTFGFICVMLLVKAFITQNKAVGFVIALISVFIATYIVIMLGYLYLTGNTHETLMEIADKKRNSNSYKYQK